MIQDVASENPGTVIVIIIINLSIAEDPSQSLFTPNQTGLFSLLGLVQPRSQGPRGPWERGWD